MIDAEKSTEWVRNVVCKDTQRKYYRFRKTKFYGGCATADCLGCNLRCAYCWAQKKVWHPKSYGSFYTPKEVSTNLLKFNQPIVRISGGEPTICKSHLIQTIKLIPTEILFILETNGVLLDEKYIRDLKDFKNLFIRISLKGVDEESFRAITSAEGRFFHSQLNTLKLLKKHKIEHNTAILAELFRKKDIQNLGIPDIEYESLIDYPFIRKVLKKRGISYPKR
jgi:uncharacterized Fe-S cluster-containing radical SAM superfamily protein